MDNVALLLRPVRKLCAEHGGRASEGAPLRILVVLLAVVGTVRHLANVYLAALVGPRLPPSSGSVYLVASAWILLAFLCSSGSVRAFHSTGLLLTHPRFRLAPVRPRTLLLAIASVGILRPTNLAVLGLYGASVAAALAVWGPASVPAVHLGLMLLAGCVACAGTYAALALWRMGDRALGYLEALTMFALVYANPDVKVLDGALLVMLFGGTIEIPTDLAGVCMTLAAFPAALAAGGVVARVVRHVRSHRVAARRRSSMDPLARLYRADLPTGILAASYVVEGVLVIGGSQPTASLRGLSAALLVLRLGWYALFLLRTEYRVAGLRPAPAIEPRARLRLYARTAPVHTVLCALPAAFHLARAVMR